MRSIGLIFMLFLPAQANAFCDPPLAPPPTSLENAKEYREVFRQEFEQYFQDAEEYMRCLDRERADVLAEIRDTVGRYQRFLEDSKGWD
jgi:hypothetical protein